MLSSDSESVEGVDGDAGEATGAEFKEEPKSDEECREVPAPWRASRPQAAGNKSMEAEQKPWVPKRVTEALRAAKDFAEYKTKRIFTFLHMFSGEEDVLGDALLRLARQADLKLKVMAVDRDRDGNDLSAEQPFGDLLDMARTGDFDGSHVGFPCGSFSRARYNPGTGPPPVRSLEFIYGLPSNNQRQQAEADRGSLMAIRSSQITGEVLQGQRLRKVPECGTLENPPGSEDRREGPAWALPEVEKFMKDFECEEAVFNTCAFQMKERTRWFKPAKFAGRLGGLTSLKRKC